MVIESTNSMIHAGLYILKHGTEQTGPDWTGPDWTNTLICGMDRRVEGMVIGVV